MSEAQSPRASKDPTTWRHLVVSYTLLTPLVVAGLVGLPLLWAVLRARQVVTGRPPAGPAV